jgi:hypothetical protein
MTYTTKPGQHLPGETAEGRSADIARFVAERLKEKPDPAWWQWLRQHSWAGPVELPPEARTRIHRSRLGPARLLAFERDIDYQMSEALRQTGGRSE